MEFFTPDLIERFGSEDWQIAGPAHDEWEERAEAYERYLSEIEVGLPQRFRELMDRFYLHDALVISHPPLMMTYLDWLEQVSRSGIDSDRGAFEGQTHRIPSHWISLELYNPPREVLVLQYRSVRVETVEFHKSIFG